MTRTEDSLQPFHIASANASITFCRPQCTDMKTRDSSQREKTNTEPLCTQMLTSIKLYSLLLYMLCINFNHLWHSISYLRMCSIHHFFINPEKLFWQSKIAKKSLSLSVSLYLSVTQTHKYLCCQARCVWVITQQIHYVCSAWMAVLWQTANWY